jgi:hypothetical protein
MTPEDQDPQVETSKPQWERREGLALNQRMKEVLQLTKQAAEQEIAALRRKLDKLTYGS